MGKLPGEQHLHPLRTAALRPQRADPHPAAGDGHLYGGSRSHQNAYLHGHPANLHPYLDAIFHPLGLPIPGDAHPNHHADALRDSLPHGGAPFAHPHGWHDAPSQRHAYANQHGHLNANTGNRHAHANVYQHMDTHPQPNARPPADTYALKSGLAWLTGAVLLTMLACNLPLLFVPLAGKAPAARVVAAHGPLVTVPPDATATATPFRPQALTATLLPTALPTPTPEVTLSPGSGKAWGDYPGPIVWPAVEISPPAGLLPQPEGQINIVLLGSDQRPYEGGFRTDTIILLTIDPARQSVHLTSFPRDLYVYIPGWTVQRINTAMAWGGFDALAQTFEYNFGVRPDHYVRINLFTFQNVVDSLGGIDVQVAVPLSDHRDGYGMYSVPAGVVHMDGETALWYVRSRYTTSDFDRTRRQQEVLEAVFYRLLSLNAIQRAPELFAMYQQNVFTDLTLADIQPLLPLAKAVGQSGNIQSYYIGPQQVIPYTVPTSGAQVLLPVREAVLAVMRQALNSIP